MTERVEGILERLDPFHLPIFLYQNAINDEQCAALREFCEQQTWGPSVPDTVGKENSDRSTRVSIDKDVLRGIPDMKEHFEILVQDISRQLLCQNSDGFSVKSSWVTKTSKGQGSPLHLHKNYYMAGILYLQDDNILILENPFWDKSNFVFPIYKQTPYTCTSASIQPPKNSFLLFPAYMKHEIPVWDKDEDRYSIAMNIHPIGDYGLETSWINVK